MLALAGLMSACSAASEDSGFGIRDEEGGDGSSAGGNDRDFDNSSGSDPSAEASPGNFGGSNGQNRGGSGPSGMASGGAAAGVPAGNTNIALSGSQDFGFVRRLLAAGQVPRPDQFDAAGFFAEHHTKLPQPVCGQRVCLQAMLGVLGNLMTGTNCTMLQVGLNSPLEANAGARPGLTMAVVVDVSGSMIQGGKIDFVRDGLGKLIDGLRDNDKIAIVTYSDRANLVFPMGEVSLNRARLRTIATGLMANGGTNLHDGLKTGFEAVRLAYDSGRQNRVILLSDGQPTVGVTATEQILTMSRSYNSEGVGLTSVGLGTDFNADLMKRLAQQADGNFYFLENSGAVSEVFTEELSFFTVPVAFDLKLELAAGTHYTFGRAHGSSFWKDNATGGALEVPSVFLAHRVSHADQTSTGGRRGGGSALLVELMPKLRADDGSGITGADVAVIKVSFREPGSNRIVHDQVVVNFPHPPWVTPERGFFAGPDISIVQKSFVMLNLFVGIENACRDFHQNRAGAGEHIGLLQRLIAAAEDYNQEVADEDIRSDIALVRQLIDVLRRNGVRDPAAVAIPQNPWPAD
jgi:Ca-activated chloride channel family protein